MHVPICYLQKLVAFSLGFFVIKEVIFIDPKSAQAPFLFSKKFKDSFALVGQGYPAADFPPNSYL